MAFLQTGVIRVSPLVAVGGAREKTLYLPPPSVDGLRLEWLEQASRAELIDGSPRTRRLGYVPRLTVRWNVYDERPGQGWVIGTGDGQRPGLEALLGVLSCASGRLAVSPGLLAGGFVVDDVNVRAIGLKGPVYSGLEVTFTGRDVFSTRTLGVF
jgi:hypothetical protein